MHSRRQAIRLAGGLAIFATGCARSEDGAAELASNLDTAFPPSIKSTGRLVTAGDGAKYTDARTMVNPRIDVKPQFIAYCKTELEVVSAVNWARDNGHRVAVRSGGHSYEGYSVNTDLVIDISGLKRFELGEDTMTIGAGWKQGELAAKLFATRANTGAVMGSCKTVGLSGFALGGGFGFLSREHGLGVDNIVSLTVVNAKGQLILADATRNKELFWALRGGGCGNFGIVTTMVYKVHPVPTNVTRFSYRFDLAEAPRVVPLWFDWIRTMDSKIVSIMNISGSRVAIVGQYLGAENNFPAPAELGEVTTRSLSYLAAIDYFNGGADTGKESRWRARSDYYLKPLNTGGIKDITKVLQPAAPSKFGYAFLFDSYGPVITNVASDAMAFAHRKDILCCMQLYMSWGGTAMGPSPAADAESVVKLRAIGAALQASGNVSGQAYPNYIDATRDDYLTAYYGANLERLKRAKTTYDPTNFFSFPQSIPLG
jgi:FAD/FMN-containing dehydrogenase